MRFLIIDDSKVAKVLLRAQLEDYCDHLEIVEASDGQEGVRLFEEKNPDVTFLDLTMPVMDGYTALRIIRSKDPKALVIVLTADIQQKAFDRCLALGACGVVKKLPRKEVIFGYLDKALGKQNER